MCRAKRKGTRNPNARGNRMANTNINSSRQIEYQAQNPVMYENPAMYPNPAMYQDVGTKPQMFIADPGVGQPPVNDQNQNLG
mmetsp:Transcript_16410/g.18260  ORF Transcript_16410/g.18260 Transcript_16410/m.18260 type:complete len:82 (+) Transcript_16410:689-934(+)